VVWSKTDSAADVARKTSARRMPIRRSSIPSGRALRPWVKLDIYNLFNNQKLISS